jgi:hypothetical protein
MERKIRVGSEAIETLTWYTSPLGFCKSGIVSNVIIFALLEVVFQARALKLSFANSCKRLLSSVPVISKICPSSRKRPFYLSSAARPVISETEKEKYIIRRIIVLPAFIRKHCYEIRCIIDDKTSISIRDTNVSFIAYAIVSALLYKYKTKLFTRSQFIWRGIYVRLVYFVRRFTWLI